MKFSLSVVVASLAAMVCAKPAFTNNAFTGIEEGQPFEVKWSGAVGAVTIAVVAGPDSDHLVPVQTILSGGTGGSFTWTPKDLPSGTYALRITDSTNEPNFSVQFPYTGTGTLTTSGASSTITSAASTTATSTNTSSSSSAFSAPTTTTSSTSSKTSSSTTTSNTSRPTNTNDSPKYKSPLALILVTVAALAYFS